MDGRSLARLKRELDAFVGELPYTATGKKQHFILKKQTTRDAEAGLFVTP